MGYKEEINILWRTLLNVSADERVAQRYQEAVETLPYTLTPKERKVWGQLLRHAWLLPYVDAGLAIRNSQHPFRKRMYLALALLEAHPSSADFLLTTRRRFLTARVALISLRACVRTVLGIVIVTCIIHPVRV